MTTRKKQVSSVSEPKDTTAGVRNASVLLSVKKQQRTKKRRLKQSHGGLYRTEFGLINQSIVYFQYGSVD